MNKLPITVTFPTRTYIREDDGYYARREDGELIDALTDSDVVWALDKAAALQQQLAAARAEVEAMRDALMDARTYLPVYAPDACHDCQHPSCMRRRAELEALHAKISRALAAQEGANG